MASKAEVTSAIKALPEGDPLLDELMTLIATGTPLPYVPGSPRPLMRKPEAPSMLNEAINPAHLVELRDIAIEYNQAWQNYYGRQWPGFAEQIVLIQQLAKQSGVDLATYAPDTFSLADIEHRDSIFEHNSQQLEQLADRLESSTEIGLRMIPDVKKKRWAKILRRVVEIQDLCRNPVPTRIKRRPREVREAWQYMHPLRFMLYTKRSHLTSPDGTLRILDCPPHLIMGSMVAECARAHAASHDIKGAIILFAPRHGKTTFATSYTALNIIQHGHMCNGVVHHNKIHAESRLEATKEHFQPNTPVGRRTSALYPHVTIDPAKSRKRGALVVLHNGRNRNIHQEGHGSAWGVHSQGQGITLHFILFDDPVDEKEQIEEGTRERTNRAMSATWLTRLTGIGSFFVFIGTRWHSDDFSGVLIDLARKGDLNVAYYAVACGGPEDDFAPLWAEGGYDAAFLRGAYARLGPSGYACTYQNNPEAQAVRRIKRLVCYDSAELNEATRTEAFQRFFTDPNTKYYLSTDPTGTSSIRSNLAGLLYSAFGDIRIENRDVPALLFLRKWAVHEGQIGLAQLIADFYHSARVDYILVETTSGFHATAEALEIVHKIPAARIIHRAPGHGSKIDRLMRKAIHIEAGDALFPGIWIIDEHGDRALQIDTSWHDLSSQILQLGTTRDDQYVDCISQQLAEVSPMIYARKYPGQVLGSPEARTPKAQYIAAILQKQQQQRRRVSLTFKNHQILRGYPTA